LFHRAASGYFRGRRFFARQFARQAIAQLRGNQYNNKRIAALNIPKLEEVKDEKADDRE
jgi:hypothetical protein